MEEHNSSKESLRISGYFGICQNTEASDLFRELGMNYQILDSSGKSEQEFAQQIGEYCRYLSKKPFIIGFPHYLMAYSVPQDATVIVFDNHSDDGIDYKPQQNFTSGTFLLFTPGEQIIVLGATRKQYGHKAIVLPPRKWRMFCNNL